MDLENRIIAVVLGGLILRLVWAAMRGFLRADPATWLTRRIRTTHKRRWAEIVRWAIILAITCLLIGAVEYGPLAFALMKSVPNVFRWTGAGVEKTAPNDGNRWFAYQTEIIDGQEQVKDVRMQVRAYFALQEETSETLDIEFLQLEAKNYVIPPNARYTQSFTPGSKVVINADPERATDETVNKVISGEMRMYIIASRQYKLGNSDIIYVSESCILFVKGFGNPAVCGGTHNRTFIHGFNF